MTESAFVGSMVALLIILGLVVKEQELSAGQFSLRTNLAPAAARITACRRKMALPSSLVPSRTE